MTKYFQIMNEAATKARSIVEAILKEEIAPSLLVRVVVIDLP
jgi:hypothetical protein